MAQKTGLKKHFNILDFGNNAANLGYYNQQREWSLFHDKKDGGGAPPVKACGFEDQEMTKPKQDKRGNNGCGAYIFASAKICPYCGYIFESKTKEKKIDLVEIKYAQIIDTYQPKWKEYERTAESRGYHPGWVINQIIANEGEDGLIDYAKQKKYSTGWIHRIKQQYFKQLQNYASQHAV